MKTKALYAFSPKLAPFVGKTPAEQVSILQEWGNTAVFGGYQDPEFVHAAHAAGLKVYAEFGCFVGAHWWQEIPSSRPTTDQGQPLEADGSYYGVNPTVPQVSQERLSALEILLRDHVLDGVWLDFIRWPCHWEVPDPYLVRTSFDPDTLARFGRDTGIVLPAGDVPEIAQVVHREYGKEWSAWRCRQITTWVARAKTIQERVRPDALLGLFGVPWRLADRDGAILEIVGQDYGALGQYVDVFSPMVYHRMCGYPPDWIGEVTQEIHDLSSKPVWPIIQSVDHPTPLSAQEYGEALDVALNSPASAGVLVFTMAGALDASKLAVTVQKFKS